MGSRDMNESGTPHAYLAQRILCGLLALPLTAYAVLMLIALLSARPDLMRVIFGLCTGTLASLCWWFALRGHLAASRRRMRFVVLGGFVLGGIGFAVGFFGPLVWAPEANQGPLLGIFFTGPLGFVVGAAAAWIYARVRDRGVGDSVVA
jgi:4-amino-4-deoxy-L-arabinose transferase-like glycosyltransferase